MAQWEKVRDRVLGGRSDANIPFQHLCNVLIRLGFSGRITGSHHTFTRNDIPDIIVIQPSKGEATAKRYQVKQVRELLL
ncbi:MAG: type II toxin-antitoxin system HicA family toxin, partial [Rubrobacteraceae bacterium]